MKLNSGNILTNMLLARLSEKKLKKKQAGLSKNWKNKQALKMSLLPDPAMGVALHQSEVKKENRKIAQSNQANETGAAASNSEPADKDDLTTIYLRLVWRASSVRPYISSATIRLKKLTGSKPK